VDKAERDAAIAELFGWCTETLGHRANDSVVRRFLRMRIGRRHWIRGKRFSLDEGISPSIMVMSASISLRDLLKQVISVV
jgi:hypothetical protein